MSISNVLPSVPELYPELPGADNLRLNQITEIGKKNFNEADHYRTVAKKYKKAQTAMHYTAVGLGSVAAALSVSGVATSLSGLGVIIGAPLGGIAALLGAASAALVETSKNLGHKVTKHEIVYSLAISKRGSIQALVSKAWNDNRITDREFQLVNSEFEQYFKLKESISTHESHRPPKEQSHDLEKLKKKTDSKRSSRRD